MISVDGNGVLADNLAEIVSSDSRYVDYKSSLDEDPAENSSSSCKLLAFDFLHEPTVLKVLGQKHSIPFAIVSLQSRFVLISPVFFPDDGVCAACYVRRIQSAPPGMVCAETEFLVSTQFARGKSNPWPAFTNPLARFILSFVQAKFEKTIAGGIATSELIDQVGMMHASSEIIPLHGCSCRKHPTKNTSRFSEVFTHDFLSENSV